MTPLSQHLAMTEFSVDQNRHYHKIQSAASKQHRVYLSSLDQQRNFIPEKVRYAQHLEGVNRYRSPQPKLQPLGKLTGQIEMNVPQARQNLRSMLEQQIREKEMRFE